MQAKVTQIEALLTGFMPQPAGYQKTVQEAMSYALMGGGKRLRPLLMEEAYHLISGQEGIPAHLAPFMAAMEMLHTYSLIHDDLPAMDDDDYRRGRKTVHVVYGEGMAVLAGDGLLNCAYETACRAFAQAKTLEEYERIAAALTIFGRKSGVYGMVGGQCADLEAEKMGDAVSEEQLSFIHAHKTGALIEASMMMGAVLAGADASQVEQMEQCAAKIGLAFQIQDDILDVTGDAETLGKPIGSDEKNNKITYVILYGLDGAEKKAESLMQEALDILQAFPRRNLFLEDLTRHLTGRKK